MCRFFCCFKGSSKDRSSKYYSTVLTSPAQSAKTGYLLKVQEYLSQDEIPLNEDGPLHCPLSLELIKKPVIDGFGFVYERKDIEQWLKKSSKHPLRPDDILTKEDLADFPELLPHVKTYKNQIQQSQLQKSFVS
jgi:U-box domain